MCTIIYQVATDLAKAVRNSYKHIVQTTSSCFFLTRGMGQVGEERLKPTSEPLHALMEVGQSLQITDVTQDLILGDQLVSEVPSQHL